MENKKAEGVAKNNCKMWAICKHVRVCLPALYSLSRIALASSLLYNTYSSYVHICIFMYKNELMTAYAR